MTSSIAPRRDAGVENFVDQRDERGDAFEREALAAEIALLHDLLEDVGADEQIEDAAAGLPVTRLRIPCGRKPSGGARGRRCD